MHSNKTVKQSLEDIFETACEAFPYSLTSTSITQGDLEADDDQTTIEFGAEFTFDVAQLLDKPLVGGGWIEIRRDDVDEAPSISGFFTIALDGDFEDGKILSDDKMLQGYYDLETQQWELNIDYY